VIFVFERQAMWHRMASNRSVTQAIGRNATWSKWSSRATRRRSTSWAPAPSSAREVPIASQRTAALGAVP